MTKLVSTSKSIRQQTSTNQLGDLRKKIGLYGGSLFAGAVILATLVIWLFIEIKKPNYIKQIESAQGTNTELRKYPLARMTDSSNFLIANTVNNGYHDRDAESLTLYYETLLPNLVKLSEDEGFDSGDSMLWISLKSFFRIITSKGKYGGSGIYQQTARIQIDLGKNKIWRKIDELPATAALIEVYKKKYPKTYKDRILLAYLNQAYMGVNIYGMQDAARIYFHKGLTDLSIAEQTTLVAMLSQPTAYVCHDDRTLNASRIYLKKVRDGLLTKAADRKLISIKQANLAKQQPISFQFRTDRCRGTEKAHYFINEVKALVDRLAKTNPSVRMLRKHGGFAAKTTINLRSQLAAEKIIARTIANYGSYGIQEGAVLVMEITTGKILVMVGGNHRDGSDSFNRATLAQRQPGSIFKPLTYLTALEAGIPPTTKYSCAASRWDRTNLDSCQLFPEYSQLDMYDAVAYSENTIAWRVAQQVGINNVIKMATRLGISSKLSPDYGTVIGQNSTLTTLMEMTKVYATIANNGAMPEVQLINQIFDSSSCKDDELYRKCTTVYDHNQQKPESRQLLNSQTAAIMHDLLKGVVHKPGATGQLADLGLRVPDVAGKTGTNGVNNDARDLWFIGYSKQQNLICAVWLGGDRNQPIRSLDLSRSISGHLGAKVFADVMKSSIANRPARH
jgi:penicillin-binding protein 1A